jgi:maltooligosyltrehalose trehalohydrolase
MKPLPLDRLGAREDKSSPGAVDFGLFLPWVSAANGSRLWVKVIHERDQFLQDIQPVVRELTHSVDPEYGDYWSTRLEIPNVPKPHPDSAWGTPGRYVYRYLLEDPNAPEPIDWIIDPFAREFGVGKLSALTLGYTPYTWSDAEADWRTPALDDLIVYELMINEFAGDIDRAVERLDYLRDLGITCIELMPVSNVANTVDWGFLPIGYFGVDERFGKRRDLQRLIDEAHRRGLAVIVDSVYGHTSWSFPYQYVYDRLHYHDNPFMGPFAKDYFGASTDFGRALTRDFFLTVNRHWLDCYHVDGFRYDCVPNYWDGPTGDGYAALVYETHRLVRAREADGGHWKRFFADGGMRLIQCAEQLEAPREILERSYSNLTWQNETLGAAEAVARDPGRLTELGFRLGLMDYPTEVAAGGETIPKSALQYIENHDHARFVCNFGRVLPPGGTNDLLSEGDRGQWYQVQPYLIGLLTAKGIPLLWQGQELGENHYVPESGWGRVMLFRPVRWDYFYDPVGRSLVGLVRKLIRLRRRPPFRGGAHRFYNDPGRYQSRGVLVYTWTHPQGFAVVALNFGDQERSVPFRFEAGGDYAEALHGQDDLAGVQPGEERWLTVPGHYGRIWTRS